MFPGTKISDLEVSSWHNRRPGNLEEGNLLIDFWSYTCSNCRKKMEVFQELNQKHDDLEVVGVHSPEFGFEKNADNLRKALEELDISYAVGHDPEAQLRASFGGLASQLIVEDGRIVWKTDGFSQLEKAFSEVLGKEVDLDREPFQEVLLGFTNQSLNGRSFRGEKQLELPSSRMKGKVYASGKWSQEENLVEAGDNPRLLFQASSDFEAVIHPGSGVRDVEVLLDGRKVSEEEAGEDLRVEEDRSYLRLKKPDLFHILEGEIEAEVTLVPEKKTRIYSVASGEV